MSLTTTAAVVEAPGAGFVLSDVNLSSPRPDEVLVRLVAAGLCHTDLGVAAGALPFPLPGVLGHEGAGVVEEVGSAVTQVRPGDQVLLSFTSCGDCPGCRGGHPAYCDTWLPRNLVGGQRPDGTSPISRGGTALGGHFFGQSAFARHAIADERSVVKVGAEAPLDVLAPLGCGVMTGVGAVWNVVSPDPGATLLITGAGAVGLSALMAAVRSPAGRVIVVDRVAERLTLATRLGAADVIDTSATDLGKAIEDLTSGRGVDAAIETTGNAEVLRSSILTLGPRGTAVIVGAPAFGTQVPVDVNFMLPGRTLVGLTLGDAETRTLIPALSDLVVDGTLPVGELITYYPFTEINTAVADVVSGRTIKPVLKF